MIRGSDDTSLIQSHSVRPPKFKLWLSLSIVSLLTASTLIIPRLLSSTEVVRLNTDSISEAPTKADIRRVIFGGLDFKNLWYKSAPTLPGIKPIAQRPSITGHVGADRHIQSLAETRGYRLQYLANDSLIGIGGQLVQPSLAKAWKDMTKSANTEGVRMHVTSGYRSPERQRQIFLSRLAIAGGTKYSHSQISAGLADSIIDKVLATTSIPGYSRHHTGYTVDLGDTTTGQAFHDFASSPAYRWLAKSNYQNAKRFGFIPNYPPDAGKQGPDPEPWEFAWIGRSNIKLDLDIAL